MDYREKKEVSKGTVRIFLLDDVIKPKRLSSLKDILELASDQCPQKQRICPRKRVRGKFIRLSLTFFISVTILLFLYILCLKIDLMVCSYDYLWNRPRLAFHLLQRLFFVNPHRSGILICFFLDEIIDTEAPGNQMLPGEASAWEAYRASDEPLPPALPLLEIPPSGISQDELWSEMEPEAAAGGGLDAQASSSHLSHIRASGLLVVVFLLSKTSRRGLKRLFDHIVGERPLPETSPESLP